MKTEKPAITPIEVVIIGILGFIVLAIAGYMAYYFLSSEVSIAPVVDPIADKASWQTVDIREFYKNPIKYDGQQLHYIATVLTITESDGIATIQIDVPIPGADSFSITLDSIFVKYKGDTTGIYVDSVIEVWGYADGIEEYKNVMGADMAAPILRAKYLNLVGQ